MDTAVQNVVERWPVLGVWMFLGALIGLAASTVATSDWSIDIDRADLNWFWIGALVGAFVGASVLGLDII